jgi:O-antigen/teichoic acid export membrane protein
MLFLSGAIVTIVLAINGGFVVWWVGESRFAGVELTALLLTGMLMRHVNATLIYTLFCFGHERRLAMTSVAEGVIGLVLMILLVPALGLPGAVIASIVSIGCVSLPMNLRALSREAGGSPAAFFKPLIPWLTRFVPLVALVGVLISVWSPAGLSIILPLGIGLGLLYVAVMLPALQSPPLGPMLAARLQPWLSRVPRLARHLVKPADALAR